MMDDQTEKFIDAIANDDIQTIKWMIRNNYNVDSPVTIGKEKISTFTGLYLACVLGNIEVVRELINAKANVNAVENKAGLSVLHLTAQTGHTTIVRELILAKANLNIRDCNSATPLHLAAGKNHLDVVNELLRAGADVNAVDKDSDSALRIAARNGHTAIVRELILAKANVSTALHFAAANNHLGVVHELLRAGADVNAVEEALIISTQLPDPSTFNLLQNYIVIHPRILGYLRFRPSVIRFETICNSILQNKKLNIPVDDYEYKTEWTIQQKVEYLIENLQQCKKILIKYRNSFVNNELVDAYNRIKKAYEDLSIYIQKIRPIISIIQPYLEDRMLQLQKNNLKMDTFCMKFISLELESYSNIPSIRSNDLDFDQFEILGKGSFGTVYKTYTKTGPKHPLALKVIELKKDMTKDLMEGISEANKMNHARHKNIVNIYSITMPSRIGENPKLLILIAMELCENDLRTYFIKEGRDKNRNPGFTFKTKYYAGNLNNFIEVAYQISNGLAFIHQKKYLHNDLKLANIMITKDGVVKITDFGLADLMSSESRSIKGTKVYMAPEILEYFQPNYSAKSDTYVLGLMFYEIWVGQDYYKTKAFEGLKRSDDIARAIVNGRRPKYDDSARPPKMVEKLIKRLWNSDLKQRPTAAECKIQLKKIRKSVDYCGKEFRKNE